MKIIILVPFLVCLAACLPTAFSGPRPETLKRNERSADADLLLEKDLQNKEESLSKNAYEFKLDEMEDGGSSYAVAYGRSQPSPTLYSNNHSLCHFYEHFERVIIKMLETIRAFLCSESRKHTTPYPYHF